MQFQLENFTPEKRFSLIYEILCRKVYKFLLIRDDKETDFFDLGKFYRQYDIRRLEVDDYLNKLMQDIRNGGWQCGTSYCKSGLFIWKNKPPVNYYPDSSEF